MEIIGRVKEKILLEEAFNSKKAEFIALYGRRRIGKTYLIKNYFEKKKCSFLYISGMKDGSLVDQLKNFANGVSTLLKGVRLEIPSSWRDAFNQLTHLIENKSDKEKFVIFLDELPWLATKKSQILQALDYYWNRHWSHNPRVKLVVCGSVASWIINNIINNKGGLYNRITRQLRLDPFSLKETEEFLQANQVKLNRQQILQLYMVTGGIPYYLEHVRKGFSAAENIEKLAFDKQGILYQDFDLLFSSLFEQPQIYIKLIRIISEFRYGIEQEELIKKCAEISRGGGAVQKLKNLENAGFIISFLPYGRKRKGICYRLIDEYVVFYLKWIEPYKKDTQKIEKFSGNIWRELRETPSWKSWAGYTFETICLKHIAQIRHKLQIPASAIASTWRLAGNAKINGAQIDLLFDRRDQSITICEIKYSEKPFKIDKEYFQKIMNKQLTYIKTTKTKKQLFIAFIASSGLQSNIYSEEISSVITLEDLFAG